MRKIIIAILALAFSYPLSAQQTTPEQLGYSQDTKLLIIHADDIGVSQSENAATLKALKEGSVNPGSIMVPCPWFNEIAAIAKENPNLD